MIIKNVILYFLHTRHSGDFPSTGVLAIVGLSTRRVTVNGPLSGTKYPTRAASPFKYNADQEPVKLRRLEP